MADDLKAVYEEIKRRGLLDNADPGLVSEARRRFETPKIDVNAGVEKPSVLGTIASETGKGVLGYLLGAAEYLNVPAFPGGLERIARLGGELIKPSLSGRDEFGVRLPPDVAKLIEQPRRGLGEVLQQVEEQSIIPVPSASESVAGLRAAVTAPFRKGTIGDIYRQEKQDQQQLTEQLPIGPQVLGLVAPLLTGGATAVGKALKQPDIQIAEKLRETLGQFLRRKGGRVTEEVAKDALREGFPVSGTVEDVTRAVVEDQASVAAGQSGVTRDRAKLAELAEGGKPQIRINPEEIDKYLPEDFQFKAPNEVTSKVASGDLPLEDFVLGKGLEATPERKAIYDLADESMRPKNPVKRRVAILTRGSEGSLKTETRSSIGIDPDKFYLHDPDEGKRFLPEFQRARRQALAEGRAMRPEDSAAVHNESAHIAGKQIGNAVKEGSQYISEGTGGNLKKELALINYNKRHGYENRGIFLYQTEEELREANFARTQIAGQRTVPLEASIENYTKGIDVNRQVWRKYDNFSLFEKQPDLTQVPIFAKLKTGEVIYDPSKTKLIQELLGKDAIKGASARSRADLRESLQRSYGGEAFAGRAAPDSAIQSATQQARLASQLERITGTKPATQELRTPQILTSEPAQQGVAEASARLRAQGVGTSVGPLEQTRVPNPGDLGGQATKDKVGNLNIAQFNTPEEVRGAVQQIAESNPQAFGMAAKQKMSRADMLDDAQKRGITLDSALRRNIGDDVNKGQAAILGEQLDRQAVSLFERAKATDITNPDQIKEFAKQLTEYAATQSAYVDVGTETARALAVRRRISGAKQLQIKSLQSIYKTLRNEKDLAEAITQLSRIDPDDIQGLNSFISGLKESTWTDKLYELVVNGWLSGNKTYVRNASGNTIAALLQFPDKALAGAIGQTIAAVKGEVPKRFMGEAFESIYGLAKGIKDGTRAFLKAMVTEQPSFGQAKYFGKARPRAIKGLLGRVIRIPGTITMATDEFFKAVNMQTALHGSAYRLARQKGLKGKALAEEIANLVTNPTPSMISNSQAEAMYRTFTQELGPIGRKFAMIKQVPGLRWVYPFFNTPLNIAKFGLEHSVLNFIRIAARQSKAFGLRPMESGELADALSRSILGTATAVGGGVGAYQFFKGKPLPDRPASQISDDKDMLHTMGILTSGGVAQLWGEGKLTGAPPDDPDERKVFYASGKLPYAVKIGDKWVQYGVEPFGVTVGLVADAMNTLDNVEEEDAVWVIGAAMATNFLNKTMTQGLSDFLNAANDPERYGNRWLTRAAGSLVPFSSLGRSINQAMDPTLRIPRNAAEGVMANVPFLASKIPPIYNIWGEPVVFTGDFATRLISPLRISQAAKDPETVEVERLNVKPGSIRRKIGNIGIADPTYQQAQQVRGQKAREIISAMIKTESYKNAPDTVKAMRLQMAFEKAGEFARAKSGITKAAKILKARELQLDVAKDSGNAERLKKAQQAFDQARQSEVLEP